jgi:hypothetical protein
MKIDRSNYEIWIIDWLDGNLDEIRVAELQLFLNENPDLRLESEELNIARLTTSNTRLIHKENLKKSPADLSDTQFELLSAGYLEDDLSSEQEEELMAGIQQKPEKKRTFDLIQKTKISPIAISYPRKNKLFRRSVAQKILRLSLIGLSAAAVISVVILNFRQITVLTPVTTERIARSIFADTITPLPSSEASGKINSANKSIPKKPRVKNQLASAVQPAIPDSKPEIISEDTVRRSFELSPESIMKLPVILTADLKPESLQNTVIAYNPPAVLSNDDDGRSKLGKFIAKTFREKILREKAPKDTPLRGYEFAEAGVSGLNKLLGWQMALDKRNDENGELKSVYFSSKILKFNAPVKKTEPLP